MTMFRGFTQRSLVFVVCVVTLLNLAQPSSSSSSSSSPNKLLLILLDGFRYDYFEKLPSSELPGFTRLREIGVSAEALVPVFPSLSFVNYYSIMTGTKLSYGL